VSSAIDQTVAIAPSILSADFRRLGEQVEEVLAAGVKRIHVDVMDGHFVPTISMGPLVVQALRPLAERSGAILEAHMMVERPELHVQELFRAGASALTVHYEACTHLHRTVEGIRALGAAPGVGLNPATPIAALDEILPEVDLVLIMSVDPGFGGQRFITSSIDKVARLHTMLVERGLEQIDIEVDGGVSEANIGVLAEAGMTIAVAGTAVFNGNRSPSESCTVLRAACAAGAPLRRRG
jgi:ribulose-phosphate 3-epimerase